MIGGIVGRGMNSEIEYNYSIGEIEIKGTGATYVGGVIGRIMSATNVNNYYLEGKSNVQLNDLAEAKDSTWMKGTQFLSNLNYNQSPIVWEYRAGENNGYPVLIRTAE